MKRQCRVLLIDDSSVSALVCETLLVAEGFDIRTATSLDQFHRALREWPPDVVLTDVQMPGTSGPDVCRKLKADASTASIPVVLYSSLPEEDLMILALQCGADGCVCKADRHEGLPRRLREICAKLGLG
jgi:two-component system cell cycle response regulator